MNESVFLFRWISDFDGTWEETIEIYKNFNDAIVRFKEVQDGMIDEWLVLEEKRPNRVKKMESHSNNHAFFQCSILDDFESINVEEYSIS